MNNSSKNQSLEYNILGCPIRIKSDEKNNKNAIQAINLLNEEITLLKTKNPNLKDIDVAVLSALNIATKSIEIDSEYRENVFALRSGVEDALSFVEKVSSQANQQNP